MLYGKDCCEPTQVAEDEYVIACLVIHGTFSCRFFICMKYIEEHVPYHPEHVRNASSIQNVHNENTSLSSSQDLSLTYLAPYQFDTEERNECNFTNFLSYP